MTETSTCSFQHFNNDDDKRILSTVGHISDHIEVSIDYPSFNLYIIGIKQIQQ